MAATPNAEEAWGVTSVTVTPPFAVQGREEGRGGGHGGGGVQQDGGGRQHRRVHGPTQGSQHPHTTATEKGAVEESPGRSEARAKEGAPLRA